MQLVVLKPAMYNAKCRLLESQNKTWTFKPSELSDRIQGREQIQNIFYIDTLLIIQMNIIDP